MDKISITINGKTFEAKGEDLMSIVEQFVNNNEQYDVPQPYEDYEDYLGLFDFEAGRCTDKEKYDDLTKKLQARLDWIRQHPKADLTDVIDELDDVYKNSIEIVKKLEYMKRACEAVQLYVVNVKNKNKK
jgi:hypothetical protein